MTRPLRGQATTELALGSLVFVVVLLFGIYFGEMPVMMLKAKEAANFAVTRATGERTHTFSTSAIASGNTYRPFDPAKVGADTNARYRDLDGMSDRSGSTFSQVMTSAARFDADCRADNRISFAVDRVAPTRRTGRAGAQASYNATFNFLRNRYRDRGGVSCNISVETTPFRLPHSFVDQGAGKMSEERLSWRTIPVCGAGQPRGGRCRGELLVLTGDWAFDAPLGNALNDDAESVQDAQVRNDPYVEMVSQLYTRNGEAQGGAGRKLLRVVAGVRAGDKEDLDENVFNMSFRGDRGARDTVDVDRVVVDAPRLKYQTSGADMRSSYVDWNEDTGRATGVPTCFLGLRGCTP